MKKIAVLGLTLLLAVSFEAGADRYSPKETPKEKKEEHEKGEIHLEDSAIKDLGIKIQVVEKRRAGRLIRIPAEVVENPLLSFTVYSPVEGIVRKLHVKEGDRVKKGQKLAEIYSPELADLIGEIEMARVRSETAKKIYERDKELYEQKVIQYTRFYTSQMEYERAQGELKALEEKLKSYGEVKGYHLILRSPVNGYVVTQNVVEGESVGPDRKLFDVHSHDVLWVYGWASEKDAKSLTRGIKGSIRASEDSLRCRIDYIGHEVDQKTRRVKVRCVAKNTQHLLKPGMFVTLEVTTGKERKIVIPKSAVQEIEGKSIAFVRTKDGFEPRELHISRELDGYVVVEEGLKEGERIAVSGTVFLKTKLVGVEEGGHAH